MNDNISLPPDGPAVYSFWDGDTCLYVGHTKNLRQRLLSHVSNKILKQAKILKFELCISKEEALNKEWAEIEKSKPTLNKSKCSFV